MSVTAKEGGSHLSLISSMCVVNGAEQHGTELHAIYSMAVKCIENLSAPPASYKLNRRIIYKQYFVLGYSKEIKIYCKYAYLFIYSIYQEYIQKQNWANHLHFVVFEGTPLNAVFEGSYLKFFISQ